MKLVTLVENTSAVEKFACVHGLSFYLELDDQKVLFDLGPDETIFANAKEAGINLSEVDLVIISHAHYDHGGALGKFLEMNHKAKVYVRECGFAKYASVSTGNLRFIGLDESLKNHPQVVLTDEVTVLNDKMRLFSGVTGRKYYSAANQLLKEERNGELFEDSFSHEQNLVITEGDKKVLIAGCAHNGIVNILERFEELESRMPDVVIGGFHLNPPSVGEPVPEAFLDDFSEQLLSLPVKYYTCHCTGLTPYGGLKVRMGDRVEYLGAGSVLEV